VTTLLVNKNNTFESLIHLTLTFGTGGRFINTSRCPLCLKVLAGLLIKVVGSTLILTVGELSLNYLLTCYYKYNWRLSWCIC